MTTVDSLLYTEERPDSLESSLAEASLDVPAGRTLAELLKRNPSDEQDAAEGVRPQDD